MSSIEQKKMKVSQKYFSDLSNFNFDLNFLQFIET